MTEKPSACGATYAIDAALEAYSGVADADADQVLTFSLPVRDWRLLRSAGRDAAFPSPSACAAADIRADLGGSNPPTRDGKPLRTWTDSGGNVRCDECCNGDRCDDSTHYSRPSCPFCKGTGNAIWLRSTVATGETPRTNAKEFVCTERHVGNLVVMATEYAALEKELAATQSARDVWERQYVESDTERLRLRSASAKPSALDFIQIWRSQQDGKPCLTLTVPGQGFWSYYPQPDDPDGGAFMWQFKEHFGIKGTEDPVDWMTPPDSTSRKSDA